MSYDLVVIGGGPAGYVACIRAAQAGLKVACIEKRDQGHLGGTCLNVGCIPTKALLESAKKWHKLQHIQKDGFCVEGLSYDWAAILRIKDNIVSQQRKGLRYLMKKHSITVLDGHGSFVKSSSSSRFSVQVQQNEKKSIVSAAHVILATGSRVRSLGGWDTSHPCVLTSDSILSIASVPKSLAIIGGGVIGIELASLFAMMGTEVYVIEASDEILQEVDRDCVQELLRLFTSMSLSIATYTSTKASLKALGADKVTLSLSSSVQDDKNTLQCEKVLLAVGREPVSDGLGLEHVNVRLDDQGFVAVNAHCESSRNGIYAIGDLIPTPALAHTASVEAEYVVAHILGKHPVSLSYRYHPAAIYSYPEIASVGDREEILKQQDVPYHVTKFPFSIMAKAKIESSDIGFTKVLSHRNTGEILGVHIIGSRATEMISEWGMASLFENTLDEVAAVVRPHPTLSEAITESAYAALEHALHI